MVALDVAAGGFDEVAARVGAEVAAGDNDTVVVDALVVTALVVPARVGLEPPQAASDDSAASAQTMSAAVNAREPDGRGVRAGPSARVTRQR